MKNTLFIRNDGTEMPLPLLTVSQIDDVLSKMETRRNERLKRIAKEQALDAEATSRFREIGERDEITLTDLERHAASLRGSREILSMILAPDLVESISTAERPAAALVATGLLLLKPRKVNEGEQGENPTLSAGNSAGDSTAGSSSSSTASTPASA